MSAGRRARGCLLGLLGVVVGLGLVAEGGDIAARHYATSRMEQRIKADVPTAKGVHGRIRSFPFLKVAITGHIDEMGATIDRVGPFVDLDVDVRAVVVQAGPLVTEGRVTVTRIGRGTVTALIPLPAISPLFAGRSVTSVQVLPNRTLAVAAAGVPTAVVPLPTADLLPCLPAAYADGGQLKLSCTFTHVPAALTALAS